MEYLVVLTTPLVPGTVSVLHNGCDDLACAISHVELFQRQGIDVDLWVES